MNIDKMRAQEANLVNGLLVKLSQVHAKWLESYINVFPDIVKGRTFTYGRFGSIFKGILLQWGITAATVLHIKKIEATYVFAGLRHRHIIDVLPSSEVLVIGGRNELFYCIKKGYKFHWAGYLVKSFSLYIWSGNKGPLISSIIYIRKLLADDKKKRYLFLWEDTLPLGMTLSTCLEGVAGLRVVCIAHGLMARRDVTTAIQEGLNCAFNLVWDQSHIKIIEGENSCKPTTFLLGLPYEVEVSQLKRRTVVLVGHLGLRNDSKEYFYTMYHFCKIYKILSEAGIEVSFRPHPQDDVEFAKKIFPCINIDDKQKLFSLGRMVFIGFTSSIMYEARRFENYVISLDISALSGSPDVQPNRILYEDEYSRLPEIILNIFDCMPTVINNEEKKLQSRFSECLSFIDQFEQIEINNKDPK